MVLLHFLQIYYSSLDNYEKPFSEFMLIIDNAFLKKYGENWFLIRGGSAKNMCKKRRGLVKLVLNCYFFLRVMSMFTATIAIIAINAPTIYHTYVGVPTSETCGAAITVISVFAYD